MKKKATPTGICNASHCEGERAKSGNDDVSVGHGPEACAAGPLRCEHQVAGAARAHQGPRLQVDDMAVLVGDQLCAQFAALAWARLWLQRHVADPLEDRVSGCRSAHGALASGSNAAPHPVAGSNTAPGFVPSKIGVETPARTAPRRR